MIFSASPTFGSDPEFFFKRNGVVIGSERVIPEGGLNCSVSGITAKIVRDGIQGEITGIAYKCRQSASWTFIAAFYTLKEHLRQLYPDVSISLDSVVDITPEEMSSLSPASRQLGCSPSENVYDPDATVGIRGDKYLKRAAGAHIHLGSLPPVMYHNDLGDTFMKANYPKYDPRVDYRKRLVPLLDVFVGNTLVLLDRDPLQAERRKYYGRAGEFRLPKHGVEYRTPSNFWLRHYVLTSFAYGMARLAVGTLSATLQNQAGGRGTNLEAELMEKIDINRMRRAINLNDASLAAPTWEVLSKFISKYIKEYDYDDQRTMTAEWMGKFNNLVEYADKNKGDLSGILPGYGTAEHWIEKRGNGLGDGWEAFMTNYKYKR